MSIRTLRADEPVPAQEPSRYLDGRGYVRLRWLVGTDEYVEEYEHRIVMGRPDGDVHHLNEDKADNRPENLRVLSKSEHAAHHGEAARARRKFGPYRSRMAMEKALRAEANRAEARARVGEMRRLYESGLSTTEVGERVGLDASGVSRKLREAGVEMRPQSSVPYLPDIDREAVRRLHREGVRASEMIKRLGVGRRRLYQVFDELGLPRFGAGTPPGPRVQRRRDSSDEPVDGAA
jgi:hypothetical protein